MKKDMYRRDFIKDETIALGTLAVCSQIGAGLAMGDQQTQLQVFLTKDIRPDSLQNMYSRVSKQRKFHGKVAIELHFV